MNLSKSRFMECYQCTKAGYLSLHRPEILERDSQSKEMLEKGTEIGEIARMILGDYKLVEVVPNKTKMLEDTAIMISAGIPVIAEASFASKNCFCSTDIIKVIDKDNCVIDVYEVKSSTSIKPEHIIDMAFQYYTITNAGYKVRNFFHVSINSDYIRDEELDINELFNVVNVLPDIMKNQSVITDNIDVFSDVLDEKEEPSVAIGVHCKSPHECPYFKYCTKHLPTPNVFDLTGKGITFAKKIELYSKGIYSFEDVISRDSKLKKERLDEVRCFVTGTDLPNKVEEIREFLKQFKYPINFFDFESYQSAIPEFVWSKPYIQMPFQYSLHILHEDGKLEHREFIAPVGSDCRIAVAENIIEDLCSNNGSIVAYNAPFEKMVIKDLAELLPHKYSVLMALRERFIDLIVPFSKQWIYKNAFKGKTSIKYVLPALFPDDDTLNYKNLEMIQNGTDAMDAYKNLRTKDKEEQEKVIANLYKYCYLDTFALYKIFMYLVDLCK